MLSAPGIDDLELTTRSCLWWIIIRNHKSQHLSKRKYLKSSSQGVSSGPQAEWYSKTWHYCMKPSHSVFLLNVAIRCIRLCWYNNIGRNYFNLITSKYFNLYSTIYKNGRGKNSSLNNLTVIYNHLERVWSYRVSSTEYLL